jgi:lipid-binding SYLF domain-containing protein
MFQVAAAASFQQYQIEGETMQKRSIVHLLVLICFVVGAVITVGAQTTKSKKSAQVMQQAEPPLPRGNHTKEGASQSTKAAKVFSELMAIPDQGIPKDLLNKAECVAVFPAVIKGGFILAAKAGRGVASCRTPKGWSAPAFLELKGGSVGLQIGGQSTDVVLLFMNTEGLKKLINTRFELGGDASVAAGPVGREAAASTDASMSAEILSYSRSKGLFAGISLKGTVISPDKSDMEGTYGTSVTALQVMEASNTRAPAEVKAFADELGKYSKRTAM